MTRTLPTTDEIARCLALGCNVATLRALEAAWIELTARAEAEATVAVLDTVLDETEDTKC